MQTMYFWCWNSTVNEIAWFFGKTSINVIIQMQGCELFWWVLALTWSFTKQKVCFWNEIYVNLFTVFPLTTNHSYTTCSRLHSPDSKWLLMSTIQASALSSFSTGELFLLFNSGLPVEKCSVYGLIRSCNPQ